MPGHVIFRGLLFSLLVLAPVSAEVLTPVVGVYGSSVCAVTACVAAARMGESCAIVEPRAHLWGMSSGGLGGVDLRMPLGGVALEIFGSKSGPNFAPSTLNATLWALINGAGPGAVRVVARAGGIARVNRDGARIASVVFAGGLVLSPRVFLDCSYDGDLIRLSGTSFAIGREAANEYNESLGGVNGGLPWATGADAGVSPWADTANTTLIAGVMPLPDVAPGAADTLVQTFNYRLCLTDNASNLLPFAPPPDYAPAETAFLRRWFVANAALVANTTRVLDLFLVRNLGSSKYDINQKDVPGLSDMPNLQAAWPLGDWAAREAVEAAHERATRAAWEFLRTDASVPAVLRADAATFGLPRDEFVDTAGFPPQLYVRESVRLRGARVLTQADVYGAPRSAACNTSVGLSQWLVDIHTAQRVALPPALTRGGHWFVGEAGGINTVHHVWQLSAIPYEALTPRREETTNLLVPVCASLTHVAWATFRLEPQYAVFGQSAAVAAVLVARAGADTAVQDVNVTALRAELRAQGQLLDAAAPSTSGALALAPCARASAWAYDARTGALALTPAAGGLCASVFGYSNVSGAAIWAAECHLDDPSKPHNQAYDLVPAGAGVRVRSRLSSLCISVTHVEASATLLQAACADADAWTVTSGGTGSTWALAASAGFLLSVRDACASSQLRPLSAAVSSTPPPAAFDPRHYPAFVINFPEAYQRRKWAESQLARVGYTSYTRVNGRDVGVNESDCTRNSVRHRCKEGLILAHLAAWERIAALDAPDARGFLVFEDDVTFHRDFVSLWPRYMGGLGEPPTFSFVYVGQKSIAVSDSDPHSQPTTILESLADMEAPWTTHAYLLSREMAAFLSRHLNWLLARAGSEHTHDADTWPEGGHVPWVLTFDDITADFYTKRLHDRFFRNRARLPGGGGGILPQWAAFQSTAEVPAALGPNHTWVKNGDVQLGNRNSPEECWRWLKSCSRFDKARESPCGFASGRLPIEGTGLAFQNRCRNGLFALPVWTGEAAAVVVPSCAELRRLITPTLDSDPTPALCVDEDPATSVQ